jgi:hypothetical protein
MKAILFHKKRTKPWFSKAFWRKLHKIESWTASGNDPDGIRTRVAGVKGQCPRPLDDGAVLKHKIFQRTTQVT